MLKVLFEWPLKPKKNNIRSSSSKCTFFFFYRLFLQFFVLSLSVLDMWLEIKNVQIHFSRLRLERTAITKTTTKTTPVTTTTTQIMKKFLLCAMEKLFRWSEHPRRIRYTSNRKIFRTIIRQNFGMSLFTVKLDYAHVIL